MTLSDWQRIEKVVHYTGFTVNAFARNVGLQRAENLYQIKRGNNGISKVLSEQICLRYPEISRLWLLTGEGEMLLREHGSPYTIPCYDTDIMHIALATVLPPPSYTMHMPRLGEVDFGAMSLSNTLSPDIPGGVMLFVRKTGFLDLIWGEAYVVMMRNGVLLRYVRQGDDSKLLLTTPNQQYDTITISYDDIVKLYRVKAWMRIN